MLSVPCDEFWVLPPMLRGCHLVCCAGTGYEDLNAIVYELDVYLVNSLDPQAVSLPPSIVFITMQLLQRTLKAKVRPVTTSRHCVVGSSSCQHCGQRYYPAAAVQCSSCSACPASCSAI